MPKIKISITINEKVVKNIDSIIDNVYIRNRSQAIEHLVKNSLGENRTAVILSGGDEKKLEIVGGVYRPTASVGKGTVIDSAVRKLRGEGFKKIYIVARHAILTKIFSAIKDGSDYGVKINYVEEKNSNGTADSLRLLKGIIKNNFIVVYSDILFKKINLEGLWNEHLKHSSTATIMLTTSATPSQKGTVKVEGNRILSFTQKPKQSDVYLVFSPIFAAEPEIFEYNGASLEMDIFPKLAEKGLLNGHLSSEKETHIHSKKDILNVKE